MFQFQYIDGSTPKAYDVVSFKVSDFDDGCVWKFICILTPTHFIYLSGGSDSGLAAGKIISFEEAISLADNNEPGDEGFKKVGTHYQIAGIIAKGFNV